MRPVILSSPANVATGLAIGWPMLGVAKPNSASPSSGTSTLHNVRTRWAIRRKAPPSLFGRPGVVVACNTRALALVQQAAIGTVCRGSARQVGLVRLFPRLGDILGLRRRNVGAVMHP